MSVTAYPTLRLKLTMPQALKLQFLPAVPGSNAAAAAAAAQAAAVAATAAANTAVAATANKVDRTGDVMSGFLTLNADPTAALHAATKHYVDVLGTSGILEAPNDGVLYGRQSLAWAAAQPLDGDLTSLAAATATNAIYYRSAANTWATVTIGANLTFTGGTLAATGGGGGGAPTTAEYITSAADATLSAERVLTNTASITWDFSTPGQAKANTAAGGGNVSNSGTPSAGQYGKWVTATTIQGVAVGTVLADIGAQPLDTTLTSLAAYNTNGLLTQTAADTFTGRTLTGPAAGISVSNGNGVSGNPTLALANDLAALEALAGTNNIYYRSGADTWTAVTFSGLTFSGGVLTATAGGGNVSNSGTPAVGQVALWVDATHIQGVSSAADQTQARSNIYAAPFDALAYNGMQINGSMEVFQEYGSVSQVWATSQNGYVADGWFMSKPPAAAFTVQQVTDAPPGFINSLKITVTTAVASIPAGTAASLYQPIEGYRTARLGFGAANAQSVTIGFWIKIHRTGTYSGSIQNGAANRSYPFSFTQSVADTWEWKTVTIPGDTTGTWAKDNTVGMYLNITLAGASTVLGTANAWAASNFVGVTGTINGIAATSDVFQITGVVILPGIEAPSAARSPLIMRPFDQELVTCRRYFYRRTYSMGAYAVAGIAVPAWFAHPVQMRATPTVTSTGGTLTNATGPTIDKITFEGFREYLVSVGSGSTWLDDAIQTADARL